MAKKAFAKKKFRVFVARNPKRDMKALPAIEDRLYV